jgi:Ca2+-transporting ATPase
MKKEETIYAPWSLTEDEIFSLYKTCKDGLTDEESEIRIRVYGENVFSKKEKKRTLALLVSQFTSPLIFILICAGVLSGVLQDWIDVVVIALALVVNAGLGFYREYHAENTLEKLTSYIKERTRIFRNGVEYEIDATRIVRGDIVSLTYGARVPADIRIISGTNFKTDEAILTGEAIPVSKSPEPIAVGALVAERKNIAHAGTLVVEGFATGVVIATGDDTEIGKIAQSVSTTVRSKTPLQKSVDAVAWMIFIVVLVIVAGIFFLGIARGQETLEMLKLSAAVAVGAVPEALPIALTVILAKGAERIALKKGIVRKLAAAETLGSTTLIMTDKTGTLTRADMKLTGIHSTESILHDATVLLGDKISGVEKHLLELALKSTNIRLEATEGTPDNWIIHGSPFEKNIAKTALFYGITEKKHFKRGEFVVPFNSTHKFSVVKNNDSYIVMGAPDILAKLSVMEKDDYVKLSEWIQRVSSEGKRLVGLATMRASHKEVASPDDVHGITFLGVLSFYDPIREEVPEVLKKIELAGVKVVLVTGDLKGTALSVAKEIGWDVGEEAVMTGESLRGLSDEELYESIANIKIFARVTPEDKMRIGRIYQSRGEVVAMTGDGVNDAPALKAMDIGISLGSGSDVAKSAADIVLLDDNFKTITLAILEGRKILGNIRKTFVYLLSNSLDAVFVIAGSLFVGFSVPLTALQIIWVNFFTGSLPALAFAFDEEFDKKTMQGGVARKKLFSRDVVFMTFGIGTLTSALLFVLYYTLLLQGYDQGTVQTVFFLCFASYVLAISFSFRSLYKPIYTYNPFSNKILSWSVLSAAIIIVATVSIPFMRGVFGLTVITFGWVWFVIGWILLNVLIVELAKYALRKISR